jgi:hypothetical protein
MQARARDLFYGLWTTDLFMQRVEANADWSLFCPNEAPGLADCWGEEHAALYTRYEREGRAKRTVKAQQLWFAVLEAQVGSLHAFVSSDCLDVKMICHRIELLCRWRQATHTCFSKILATGNPTSKTWEQSSAAICAQR